MQRRPDTPWPAVSWASCTAQASCCKASPCPAADQRARHRMQRMLRQRGGHGQGIVSGNAFAGMHLAERKRIARQGAGLVEHHRVHRWPGLPAPAGAGPARRCAPGLRRWRAWPPAWPATARRDRSRSGPPPPPSAHGPGHATTSRRRRRRQPAGQTTRNGLAMRSASCASCGLEVEALSISATIWANRVWLAGAAQPAPPRRPTGCGCRQSRCRPCRAAGAAIRPSAAIRRPACCLPE